MFVSRFEKLGDKDSKRLLQRLNSLPSTEGIHRQESLFSFCMIDVIVYVIAVDGKEVGITESQFLCQSMLDLDMYIGNDPFR
ncbi:hypothetical protein MLD38_012312 [Melastoma candidum]|uniref:Uncharacterized protein n=1 Tax=Melastoma candidum TaxID=119954 RepID=A0ACB9REC9_9MYRT|nr:hypothetical protein MLD38_012312 [Melastoma candidum]